MEGKKRKREKEKEKSKKLPLIFHIKLRPLPLPLSPTRLRGGRNFGLLIRDWGRKRGWFGTFPAPRVRGRELRGLRCRSRVFAFARRLRRGWGSSGGSGSSSGGWSSNGSLGVAVTG